MGSNVNDKKLNEAIITKGAIER